MGTQVQGNIDEFQRSGPPTPQDVKQLAKECMEKDLDLDNAAIQQLAGQINDAISGVSNVDAILDETKEDLQRAEDLSRNTKRIRENAELQLQKADNITNDLGRALEAQNDADNKIQSANGDIDSARTDLGLIEHEMNEAMAAADASVEAVQGLSQRQEALQTKYIKNDNRVRDSKEAANQAKEMADDASDELYKLNTEFKNVSDTLDNTSETIGSAKTTAINLQQRATKLANEFSNKLNQLVYIEKEFEDNEKRLIDLSSELVSLNCEMQIHLEVIMDKSNFYRTCSPSMGTWQPKKSCTCSAGNPEPECVI